MKKEQWLIFDSCLQSVTQLCPLHWGTCVSPASSATPYGILGPKDELCGDGADLRFRFYMFGHVGDWFADMPTGGWSVALGYGSVAPPATPGYDVRLYFGACGGGGGVGESVGVVVVVVVGGGSIFRMLDMGAMSICWAVCAAKSRAFSIGGPYWMTACRCLDHLLNVRTTWISAPSLPLPPRPAPVVPRSIVTGPRRKSFAGHRPSVPAARRGGHGGWVGMPPHYPLGLVHVRAVFCEWWQRRPGDRATYLGLGG